MHSNITIFQSGEYMDKQPLIMRVNKDLSENVYYLSDNFPAYIGKNALSEYPGYLGFNHWHPDVEFMAIISGKMRYNINGEIMMLQEGDAVFINSKQMHYGFSDNYQECIFVCVTLNLSLLETSQYVKETFIDPVVCGEFVPYYIFRQDVSWEREVYNSICDFYKYYDQEGGLLKVQSLFLDIWCKIYKNVSREKYVPIRMQYNDNIHLLKNMVLYLQERYNQKLTLQEIADAGCVGKTTCCNLFKKYTGKTPLEYLIHYRIQMSLHLLKDMNLTITQVAYEVGFSGASYFSETFKKVMKMTPNEYRKQEA